MKSFLLFGLSIFLCLGCSTVKVGSTVALTDDFSMYKTYNFYEPEATTGPYYNDLVASIEKQLNARGMTKSTSPDLMINIGTSVKDVTQTRDTDYRDIQYSGQRTYNWESQEVVVNEYKEGTVILDFVDTSSGQMVWQGSASSMLDNSQLKKKEKMVERIDATIAKLFTQIPQ